MYKGIPILQLVDSTYPVWAIDLDGYMCRTNKRAHAAMHGAAEDVLVAVRANADNVDDAGVVPPPVRVVVVDDADLEAASIIRLFMSTELKQVVMHLTSGRALWTYLQSQFALYANAHAPLLSKSLRSIGPNPGETVAAYCARGMAMVRQLAALDRTVSNADVRDLLWEGLERERPAWETTVEAMRASFITADLDAIVAHMRTLELSKPALSPNAGAGAFAAHVGGKAPSVIPSPANPMDAMLGAVLALTARFEAMEAKQAAKDKKRPSKPPQPCYVCGLTSHLAGQCPKRFGAPGTSALADADVAHDSSCSEQPTCLRADAQAWAWVLDSGSNRHLSAGGEAGFRNYRVLDCPQPVRFGKRGSLAYAVGVGDVVIGGVEGPVVLPNVLRSRACQPALLGVMRS
jgi:gag-polypeptide of LTR copia-type